MMNQNYIDPEFDEFEEDDDEVGIDILGIFARLLKKWKQIVAIGFTFGLIGVVIALNTTKLWTVHTSIAPEVQKTGSSSLNSIANMLGVGGLSMGSSVDAINVTLFPQICQSTPFITELFNVKISNPEETTTVFDHVAGKDKPISKIAQKKLDKAIAEGYDPASEYIIDPANLTKLQRAVFGYLAKNIVADVDNKTGFTTVSVTMDDPEFATQLADTVLRRLQEYVIRYRTEKAEKDLEYYELQAKEAKDKMVAAQAAYASSVDYDRSVILQSVNSRKEILRNEANLAQQVYSQMEQQKELARAKVQEMKPVFAVVQPATMPKDPITSKKKIVLIWGILGGFLACAWYGFGEKLLKSLVEALKSKMKEEDL